MVQWLALWTLNPAILVQISVEPSTYFPFFLCMRGGRQSYLKRPEGERDGNSRSNSSI